MTQNGASGGRGGAIYNAFELTMTHSQVSDNFASLGGGISSIGFEAMVTASNSTITTNSAFQGGGLFNIGQASLLNLTVAENSAEADGGIYNQRPEGLTLKNTIVANNAGGDCGGPSAVVTAGHNLTSDETCGLGGPGDVTNTDPRLGPLADNGGPTQTHALLVGSPAIDAGDNADCPAADQRGSPRPTDGDLNGSAVCDIGAYEREGPLAATPSPSATPAESTPSPTPGAVAPAQLPATGGEPGSVSVSLLGGSAALLTAAVIPLATLAAVIWRRRSRR
jgi:hypothetical protein